jgi:hypothetical protein
VKNYLFRAFEKIGVSSRVELLFYLLRQQRFSIEAGDSSDVLSKYQRRRPMDSHLRSSPLG